MAARARGARCPVCGARVKEGRLETHLSEVHPDSHRSGARGGGGLGARRLRLRREHIAIIVAVFAIIAAALAYFTMSPRPEEYPEVEPPLATEPSPTAYARVETSMGPIVIALYGNETPSTVRNFIDYVGSGYYSGTIFHRVVEGFVIQGGGFHPDMTPKEPTRDPIALETHPRLRNERGTVAMARTSDPDSATSQFYINLVNNTSLDPSPGNPGYAVFGRVVRGMEIVDAISHVPVSTQKGYENVPNNPIVITSVMLISAPDG
ncbi:MAG: peptidylprolyl isomerase [Thermoplasmatota archaeon]